MKIKNEPDFCNDIKIKTEPVSVESDNETSNKINLADDKKMEAEAKAKEKTEEKARLEAEAEKRTERDNLILLAPPEIKIRIFEDNLKLIPNTFENRLGIISHLFQNLLKIFSTSSQHLFKLSSTSFQKSAESCQHLVKIFKILKMFSRSSQNPQNLHKLFATSSQFVVKILSTSSKSSNYWKSFRNLQNHSKHF